MVVVVSTGASVKASASVLGSKSLGVSVVVMISSSSKEPSDDDVIVVCFGVVVVVASVLLIVVVVLGLKKGFLAVVVFAGGSVVDPSAFCFDLAARIGWTLGELRMLGRFFSVVGDDSVVVEAVVEVEALLWTGNVVLPVVVVGVVGVTVVVVVVASSSFASSSSSFDGGMSVEVTTSMMSLKIFPIEKDSETLLETETFSISSSS